MQDRGAEWPLYGNETPISQYLPGKWLRGEFGSEDSEMRRELGDIFIAAGGVSNDVKLFTAETSDNGVVDNAAGCRVEED